MFLRLGILEVDFSFQANSIDPTNVESLLLKGLTLLEVKKTQEAIFHYQSAVRLAPQRFESYKGNEQLLGDGCYKGKHIVNVFLIMAQLQYQILLLLLVEENSRSHLLLPVSCKISTTEI